MRKDRMDSRSAEEVRTNAILLVEDNDDDIELTLLAFAKSRVPSKITVVRDGVAAIEYLLGGPEAAARPLPRVVLLDLKLPRLSGLDVLRRLRSDERTRLLPVVVLTSSAEEQDLVGSYRLGANSYVRKPIDFAKFLESAEQLGLYWLELNRNAPGDV